MQPDKLDGRELCSAELASAALALSVPRGAAWSGAARRSAALLDKVAPRLSARGAAPARHRLA
jgi:hypothetical protein